MGEDFWLEVKVICLNFKIDLILRCIMILKIIFFFNMFLRYLILDFLVNVMIKGIVDYIFDCYKDIFRCFIYINFFLEN